MRVSGRAGGCVCLSARTDLRACAHAHARACVRACRWEDGGVCAVNAAAGADAPLRRLRFGVATQL
jgi:hypothetical protein